MEVHSAPKRKLLPKRKKAIKADRGKKKTKRSSRKEKKQSKNVEKKTRSGCTYSPYEILIDKSESVLNSSSDIQTPTGENQKMPAVRKVILGDSDKDMAKLSLGGGGDAALHSSKCITQDDAQSNQANKPNWKDSDASTCKQKTRKVVNAKKDFPTNNKIKAETRKSKIHLELADQIMNSDMTDAEDTLRKIKNIIEVREQKNGDMHEVLGRLWGQKLKGLPDSVQPNVKYAINNVFKIAYQKLQNK